MLDIIQIALSVVSLFCFIYTVVKMFQNGQTALGIGCLIGALCCGIGGLVAFAFGWIRSGQWNIKGLMLIWTVAIIAGFVLSFVHTPAYLVNIQQQIQKMQQGK